MVDQAAVAKCDSEAQCEAPPASPARASGAQDTASNANANSQQQRSRPRHHPIPDPLQELDSAFEASVADEDSSVEIDRMQVRCCNI